MIITYLFPSLDFLEKIFFNLNSLNHKSFLSYNANKKLSFVFLFLEPTTVFPQRWFDNIARGDVKALMELHMKSNWLKGEKSFF